MLPVRYGNEPSLSIYAQNGKKTFVSDVKQVIKSAKELASSIPGSRSDGCGRDSSGTTNIYYTDRSWNWFSYPVYGYSYGPSRDDSGGKVLGILLAISSVVTCYFIGKDAANLGAANSGLKAVRHQERTLSSYQECGTVDRGMTLLSRVVNAEKEIFSLLKASAETGLALKVCLATTLAVAAGGLFFSIGAVAALGFVGAFFSGVAMAVKAGFDNIEAEAGTIAKRMLKDIRQLEKIEPVLISHAT